MAKVTLITQTKNSEKNIEKCINSVLSQSFNDFTYYIIDINSSDKTREIVNSFSDERIKKIFVNKNNNTINEILKEIYSSDS